MLKVPNATMAVILAIALYFTLVWGFDAIRMLTLPTYGLEDVWRSQFIFSIGRVFGLGPIGLIKLAAFFGTLKLAVAVICGIHIVGRFRRLIEGKTNSEILEGGLILALLISIAAAGPAAWLHNADLLREQTIQLILAGVAIALSIAERNYGHVAEVSEPVAATPQGASWFRPWR